MIKAFEARGLKAFETAYADILKTICSKFGYEETHKDTQRHMLLTMGDRIRKGNPDYFIDVVFGFVKAMASYYDVAIITDARFANELQPANYKDLYDITNVLVYGREATTPVNDITEELANKTSKEKFHYCIENSGNAIELAKACSEFVDCIIAEWLVDSKADKTASKPSRF